MRDSGALVAGAELEGAVTLGRARRAMPLAIALVTVITFLPALRNGFVNWDDDWAFLSNPHYRGLGAVPLQWMWTTFHLGHYQPLTWMTSGLDYTLWGLDPFGYHLGNLVLHTANAVLVYWIARRLMAAGMPGAAAGDERARFALPAAFAALLFAIHPLRVESVAWATERRDVLCGFFYLLAALAYLKRFDRDDRNAQYYRLSLALFACALLSKSMAVSLPVVLLVIDAYPLRRLGGKKGWFTTAARAVYLEKAPFVLLAAGAALLAPRALGAVRQLDLAGKIAASAYSAAFYLFKTVAPFNLSPLYPLPLKVDPIEPRFLLSYTLVAALVATAWVFRRRSPALVAALVAYVAILLPVIGIVQNGPQIAADRYTYLAGAVIAIAIAAALERAASARAALRRPLEGLTLCALIGFGISARNQTAVWHDSATLWSRALAVGDASPTAHDNLGMDLLQRGNRADAIAHFRAALSLDSSSVPAHIGLGIALMQAGTPAALDSAIQQFEQAAQFDPTSDGAYVNWGAALARQGKTAEAIAMYERAIKLNPDNADGLYNWGTALALQDKLDEAAAEFMATLAIRPDYAGAHNNLGVALARKGDFPGAIEQYGAALATNPRDAEAHVNWGNALVRQKRPEEAVAHYRAAVAIRPNYTRALLNWGVALAQQDSLAGAIEQFQAALAIDPSLEEARAYLDAAIKLQRKR